MPDQTKAQEPRDTHGLLVKWSDDDQLFIARILEADWCSGHGVNRQEAIAMCESNFRSVAAVPGGEPLEVRLARTRDHEGNSLTPKVAEVELPPLDFGPHNPDVCECDLEGMRDQCNLLPPYRTAYQQRCDQLSAALRESAEKDKKIAWLETQHKWWQEYGLKLEQSLAAAQGRAERAVNVLQGVAGGLAMHEYASNLSHALSHRLDEALAILAEGKTV